MRFIIISSLSFTLIACLSLAPDLEWEDVTSDHDPVLNVFGLLSADSILTSFVRVHRTLDCLLYTSPSPRDLSTSRMPSSA